MTRTSLVKLSRQLKPFATQGTSRLPSTVRRCTSVSARYLSSSCSRHASEVDNDIRYTGSPAPVRPSAIWLAKSASNLNHFKILDQLPRAVAGKHEYLRTALFFVTPQLAHLFDPGHEFHTKAINNIFGSQSSLGLRKSIVAVVDALPAITTKSVLPKLDICGSEGIALCLSTDFRTNVTTTNNAQRPPVISFTGKPTVHDVLYTVSFQAPIANTIFVNGRNNTMFELLWSQKQDGQWLEVDDSPPKYLSSLEVPIYTQHNINNGAAFGSFYGNLFKLTDPAVVVSSMGNILRQVQKRDGKTLPASHDLEEIVPALVKAKQQREPWGELRVFAFVLPPQWPTSSVPLINPFKDRLFSKKHDLTLRRYDLLDMLIQGARLYRVTSGGAGWGKQAGLLSLEPMIDLERQEDSALSSFPDFNFDDDEIRMPGSSDLFPPGHIVQFAASWHDPSGRRTHGDSVGKIKSEQADIQWLNDEYFASNKLQKFCVGTAVVEEAASEQQVMHAGNKQEVDPVFCPNRFGFLASSAMSLSVKPVRHGLVPEANQLDTAFQHSEEGLGHSSKPTRVHSTLVDIPNSCFISTLSAGDEDTQLMSDAVMHQKFDAAKKSRLTSGKLQFDSQYAKVRRESDAIEKMLDDLDNFDDPDEESLRAKSDEEEPEVGDSAFAGLDDLDSKR